MVPSTLLIELICFIFSVIYLKDKKLGYWYYLIWFMLVTTLLDGIGWAIAVFLHKSNHWVYNIELPFEVYFIAWLFNKIFEPFVILKKWIVCGILIFSSVYLYEGFKNHFTIYNDFSDTIAAVMFVFAGGYYYYLLLKNEEYILLYKHPPFWLVTGMFLFYFTSTAVNIFFDELMQLNITKGISLRYIIFTVLNAILYGCWIYAFKCKYRQIISSF